MVKLTVNGKPVELRAPTPLVAYLRGLGIDPGAVAVELNERIVERKDFEGTTLDEGDVVEIVRMVGGGVWRDAPAPAHEARRGGELRYTSAGTNPGSRPALAAPPPPRLVHPTAPCRRP